MTDSMKLANLASQVDNVVTYDPTKKSITSFTGEEIPTGGGNFNKIINSNMQVAQRGRMHYIKNISEYHVDRMMSGTADDNALEVRQEKIYSPNAGSWVDETDPFLDGKLNNLWKLDGDATDLLGNNDGTVNGDTSFIDSYIPNIGSCKVATFDGDGDYIDTGFKIGDQTQYTLFATFKLNSVDDDLATILAACNADGSANGRRARLTFAHSNVFRGEMGDDDSAPTIDITLPYTVEDGLLHNIVLAVDGYDQYLYLDGEFISKNTYSVSAGKASDSQYVIGRFGDYDGNYFNGEIARVGFFLDKALTADEVKKLYVWDKEYRYKSHMQTILAEKGDTYTVTPLTHKLEGQTIKDLLYTPSVFSFELASNVNQDYTVNISYEDGSNIKTETVTYEGNGEFVKFNVMLDPTDFDHTKMDLEEGVGFIIEIGKDDELNVGDDIRITIMQLIQGTVPVDYQPLDYGSELQRCMRYYNIIGPFIHQVLARFDNGDGDAHGMLYFDTMRCTPLASISGVFNSTGGYTDTPLLLPINANSIRIESTNTTSASGVLYLTSDTNNPGKIIVDAEL